MVKRLLGIVYLLMKRETVPAAELAEKFEVSIRTIYRDIDALCMAGIPVYTKMGKNGGISLVKQFVLDKVLISKEEQQQILSALTTLKETGVQSEKEILQKLSDFFQMEPVRWVAIDLSGWSSCRQTLFETVKKAILTYEIIEFDYYGQYGDMTHLTAAPVQLLFKNYTWYLRAFCQDKNAMCLFKLLRMKRVALTGRKFLPDNITDTEEIDALSHTAPSSKCKKIILEIDASEAYRVYDRFDEEEITVRPDGSFLIQISYPLDDWVYGLILSFAASAKVIEPEEVRTELQKKLVQMQNRYSPSNN